MPGEHGSRSLIGWRAVESLESTPKSERNLEDGKAHTDRYTDNKGPFLRQDSCSSSGSSGPCDPPIPIVAVAEVATASRRDAYAPSDSGATKKRTRCQRCAAWICMPNSRRKWVVFIIFWGLLIAGLIAGFVVSLPYIVNGVVEPATTKARKRLERWELGVVFSCCLVVFPMIFIPKVRCCAMRAPV